jgi:hypothetical protein
MPKLYGKWNVQILWYVVVLSIIFEVNFLC